MMAPMGWVPFAWLRRHWIDGVTLVVLLGAAAGLLLWRNAARRADGGLTVTAHAGPRPGSRVLRRFETPAPDINAAHGPRAPAGAKLVRYEGWIYVPHRGHFVFDLWLRGQGRLRIGDTRPITGRSAPSATRHGQQVHWPRLVKSQRLLERGWHPLVLDYRPAAERALLRLLWQPPGRRGDPDYVPPARLRPAGPRPQSTPTPHPHRRDFWVVCGLALLLLGALVVWLRGPLRRGLHRLRVDPQARLDALAALALGLGALAVRLWGLDAAGQTWDEDVYFGAGRNYWLNWLALDFRPESWAWNLEHPPITKYLVGFGALWSESLTVSRAVSAALGGLTASLVYLVGRDGFSDRRVGLVAGLLVALLPSLVAHGRVAGHEAPSVLLYTLTVYLAWRGLGGVRPRWGLVIGAGACLGLAVGTRLINVTVVAVVLALVASVAWDRHRDHLPAADRVVHLVTLGAVALVTFFFTWPRLWHHPVYHLGELFTYWPPGTERPEYFLGRLTTHSWAYFPVYAVVTTPTVVLVGVALFFVRLGWRRSQLEPTLLAWLVAPLLITALVPFCRDGVRYVLPIAVPIALASAAGGLWAFDSLFARLWRRARERRRRRQRQRDPEPAHADRAAANERDAGVTDPPADRDPRRRANRARRDREPPPQNADHPAIGLAVVLVLMAAPVAWATWRFQPYPLDYYNVVSGGPEAALERRYYEWSWWGEGLGNAVGWINRHGPPNARVGVDVPARHTMVLSPDMRTTTPHAKPPPRYLLLGGEGLRRLWDRRRGRWRHPPGYEVAHDEQVVGWPLIRVYRRQDAP